MASLDGKVGIGFRMEHARELLERKPECVDWLEIHPENYMHRGGVYPANLKQALRHWPVVTHGLTMGMAAEQPHDVAYLHTLKSLLSDVETPWHSDHLCFASDMGMYAHDLLPMPFNEESLKTVVQRMTEVRDRIDTPIAFENISYYIESPESTLGEPEFIVEALEATDGLLLLDVNNVYVNSKNLGFDPKAWIDLIPADRVIQIHVAGHLIRKDGFRIDTHGEPVCDDVYELLEYTLEHTGPKPVLLERDGNYPPLDALLQELELLKAIVERTKKSSSDATLPGVGVRPESLHQG